MSLPVTEDTIAAISTPLGEGGIGIVRLSGPEALAIAGRVFRSSKGRDVLRDKGRIFHGHIHERGAVIDEVLLHVMRAPHSYTCEDVAEINCHGGLAAVRTTLELVLGQGARLAAPGEFTKRAFLNGRLDLVQAEAVIDFIQARTRAGLRAASAAAEGRLSREIHAIQAELTGVEARIEAAIDFPDQDLPELINDELRAAIVCAHERVAHLLSTADAGRLYREGAVAAIAGRPNVGKSSLFNALLRESRAIVTAQPGTTRDRLEETCNISGIPLRLVDTAGLRTADDEAEQMGVAIARKAVLQADIALFLVDATDCGEADQALFDEVVSAGAALVFVMNKFDLNPDVAAPIWAERSSAHCRVSALTGAGLDELEAVLAHQLRHGNDIAPDEALVTRVHQQDSLRRAAAALERLADNMEVSPEFLSIEVQEAMHALGEITGETTPDDILDRVFAGFCIGK